MPYNNNSLINQSSQQDYEVLTTILKHFEPYLKISKANEIIINREKELYLVVDNKPQIIEDEILTEEFLINFCQLLAKKRNLLFNLQNPSLACSIPNTKYRVNAIHPSVTANNEISLCIRIPTNTRFDLSAFPISPKCQYTHDDLKRFMREGKNILISGGTGSGKTSLLNSLIAEIPKKERIVSVEDSPELNLDDFDNRVQLLVGKNEDAFFTYENALNNAMRMTPQRLMVGELDTRNILLFLRLGNTGHKGMVSTIHSDSVESILEAIALNIKIGSQKDLALKDIAIFLKKSIDILVQINKDYETGKRVIQEIGETEKIYAHYQIGK